MNAFPGKGGLGFRRRSRRGYGLPGMMKSRPIRWRLGLEWQWEKWSGGEGGKIDTKLITESWRHCVVWLAESEKGGKVGVF